MEINQKNTNELLNHIHTSGSGYDLLRYVCLPDLLGRDANSILYVMGKNLARNVKVQTIDDLKNFFVKTGWGNLILLKEKRRELIFELTGDAISKRSQLDITIDYRLEAGFLAESIQLIKDCPCECVEESNKKKQLTQFNVMYTK
ncbi:YslB family protein [Aquibacillus saliphilus]|uniref:YslB family protein n=1 Tax=Aquibacillus saliphilus TaxID=1909422 RepID=UPI001CEFB986|nr:YslB family protein [Aquibacillus saliphilus]